MPRRYLKHIMPDHREMRENRYLKRFGTRLAEPRLWYLNRRSIAIGLAVGVFVAFMPIPGQMLVSAFFAILFRFNLPIAVMAVWITNPVTLAPIYFLCYQFGAWLLSASVTEQSFSMSWEWFLTEFLAIWQPLILGCVVIGAIGAILSLVFVRITWRIIVIRHWRQRHHHSES